MTNSRQNHPNNHDNHEATAHQKRLSRLHGLRQRLVFRSMGIDYDAVAPLFSGKFPAGYSVGVLTTDDDKQEARSVVTKRYLADGTLTESEVETDEKGRVTHRKDLDTSHEHSVYFAVKKDGQIVITSRFIMPHNEKGFASFHVDLKDLYEESREQLLSTGPTSYMEFSSYARAEGNFTKTDKLIMRSLLIREMLRFSWLDKQADGKIWFFGLRSAIVPTYRQLFGDSMVQLGNNAGAAGFNIDLTPFAVDPNSALETFIAQSHRDVVKRLHLQIFLSGLSEKDLQTVSKKIGNAHDLTQYR